MCLINAESKNEYPELKKIFFKDLKAVSKEKRYEYYNYMIILNIERANISVPGALEEIFYLINKKLKEGIVEDIMYNEMPVNKFRDYIFIATGLGKIRWAENFIKKYGDLLPPEISEDIILIAKALIFYHKKNFIECYKSLYLIKRKDPFFYIDVSVLKLKVNYDLKNADECHNVLKNLKVYLRKERVIQEHLKVYAGEFCKDLALLLKLRQNPTKRNLTDLQYRLKKYNLIGKKWIIAKLKEIKI